MHRVEPAQETRFGDLVESNEHVRQDAADDAPGVAAHRIDLARVGKQEHEEERKHGVDHHIGNRLFASALMNSVVIGDSRIPMRDHVD